MNPQRGQTRRNAESRAATPIQDAPPALDLAAIYENHATVVFRRALTILANEEEAREVVQEIFLSLIRDPGRFHGRSSITTWLYRVTTNTCLNRIRDRRNRARLLAENLHPEALEIRPERTQAWVEIRQVIGRMPENLATALVFHVVDGMTHDEIAPLLGCSRRNVGHLIRRALMWAKSEEVSA